MRRALYVVRAPDFEDDPPASDRTLVQPSGSDLPIAPEHAPDSVTADNIAANAAEFDELPTIIKPSPQSHPNMFDTATSEVRVNTRHVWSEESAPSVEVNDPGVSFPLPPMSPEEKASFFSRDQITRLEAPVAPVAPVPPVMAPTAPFPHAPYSNAPYPSAPLPNWSEPTAPGTARARPPAISRSTLLVRIAMGVVAVFLLVTSLRPKSPPAAPTAATASATGSAAAPLASTRPSAARPVTTAAAPAAAAVPADPGAVDPTAAAAASGGSDEVAAVDAVESGDLARAAKLYAALSAAHPTNDAYREAARILRESSKGAHP